MLSAQITACPVCDSGTCENSRPWGLPGGRNVGSSGFNENAFFPPTESSGNSDLHQHPAADYPDDRSGIHHYRWDEGGKNWRPGCREIFLTAPWASLTDTQGKASGQTLRSLGELAPPHSDLAFTLEFYSCSFTQTVSAALWMSEDINCVPDHFLRRFLLRIMGCSSLYSLQKLPDCFPVRVACVPTRSVWELMLLWSLAALNLSGLFLLVALLIGMSRISLLF